MLKAKTGVALAFLALAGWLVARGVTAAEPAVQAADRPDAAEKASPATDAFGDPLPAYARLRLGTLRFRQGSAISSLRYLPDGKTLVSVGSDQVMRFWEASSGKQLYRFGAPVTANAASGLPAGLIPNLEIGIDPDNVPTTMRVLSADGKRVATVEADQTIKLWDPATGKEVGRLGKPLTNGAARNMPAFSDDGKVLAVSEYDGTGNVAIQIFDVATGRDTIRLTGPDPKEEGQTGFQLQSFVLAPDGKSVIALGNENGLANKLRLWQVATGKTLEVQDSTNINPVALNAQSVNGNQSLFFSPDGKRFALLVTTTNQDNGGNVFHLRLWDAATGKKLRDVGGHPEQVSAIHFAPDGQSVALVTNNQSVKVHDLKNGKERYALAAGANTTVMTLAFTPDRRTLAVGGADHSIQLYDAAQGNLLHELKSQDGKGAAGFYALTLAFATDSKTLAVGGSSVIRLWDVASGKAIHPVRAGHEGMLNALVIAPNGKLVATAGGDNTVRLWDPAGGKQVRQFDGPAGENPAVNVFGIIQPSDACLAFSSDSRLLGIGWSDGTIDLWDLQTGKRAHQLKGHQMPTTSLAFAPNGKALASGGMDGRALWWDVTSGKMLRVISGRPIADEAPDPAGGGGFPGIGFDVATMAMAPDGRTLAVTGQDLGGHVISLYETATFQARRKLRFKAEGTASGLNPIQLGNAFSSPFMGTGLASVSALRFTPDGKGLLWTSGTTTRLVDLVKGKEIRRFGGQEDSVNGTAVSPDGKLLAGAGGDGTVQFWDVASGTALGSLTGHRGAVSTVAFTPDGKGVVTGGADTTALLWDVPRFLEDTRLAPKELADERLAALWKTVGSENAEEAFQAMHQLQAVPRQAVGFLGNRIKPAPPTDTERIARLVADLESERFEVRKLASQSLERLGQLAETALRKRLADSPPLEVQQRVEQLLEKLAGPITDPDTLRAHRGLEILEHIGSAEAKALLQTLARGAPEARLTREAKEALERLK